MKKTYMIPVSEQVNLITENMIAASSLVINPNESADQWSNEQTGWDCDDWSGIQEEEDF